MKRLLKLSFIVAAILGLTLQNADAKKVKKGDALRLVYWNIQNGMWDGQDDNYNRFVDWVAAQKPDVCVWCEAQPIYKSGTADKLDDINSWRTDEPLIAFWKEVAARYGHQYVFLGGHRDNYPQVITSKYPITEVARITGTEEIIVSHGAGWATIEKNGHKINIVTLHTWPQAYSYSHLGMNAEQREKSKAEHGGDYFRRTEMQYICEHTIGSVEGSEDQLWMMMGDFNSRSRVDQSTYKLPDFSTSYLVHDYIIGNTPYFDIIHELHPGKFITSTGGQSRIDFVYATKPLLDRVVKAEIITDSYTKPIRDEKKISNFWHPSDHRPIIVDFNMKK